MQPSLASSRHACRAAALLAVALLVLFPLTAAAQQISFDWRHGPATQALGADLAEVEVPDDYVFLDAPETQRLMEYMENPLTEQEVGTLAPAADDEGWFVVFEYDETGYVSDAEADTLDPDAILKSIREGTALANEERVRRGWTTMEIIGWQEEPHYDALTHNLTWAIVGRSDHGTTINKIVKVLGRRGVMTATLVASPEELVAASPRVDILMAGFDYRPGNTYAEFVPGTDTLAKYGLAALVVGGAGAALVQSGFLLRFWKSIVAVLVGLAAGMKRLFGSARAEDQPISQV